MSAGKIIRKGVDIKLEGEPHRVRFTMAGLAYLADKYGSVNKVMEVFQDMTSGQLGNTELTAMADLLYSGLLHEGGELTVEAIMSRFDVLDIIEVTPALVEAFTQSMGVGETSKKKNPPKA